MFTKSAEEKPATLPNVSLTAEITGDLVHSREQSLSFPNLGQIVLSHLDLS